MAGTGARLSWLDRTRGIAILWVFVVHFVEMFMGGASFANPRQGWPPLAERLGEWAPLPIAGAPGVFANVLRYVAWPGDQAVQVFLIASAFILTRAALSTAPTRARAFWKKRLLTILPQWWLAHLALMVLWLFTDAMSPFVLKTWLSFFGLRMLPQVWYYGVAAWWFIGLLLQVYLAFPLLLRWLNALGPYRFAAWVGGTSILIRLAGLYVFDQYLDWWSRGALLIPRLPEVALGMSAAMLLARRPELATPSRTTRGILLGLAAVLVGNVASFFLAGCAVSLVLTGGGWFLLGFLLADHLPATLGRPLEWMGRHSYSFFLTHHFVIQKLVPETLSPARTGAIIAYLVTALAISLVLTVALDRAAAWALGAVLGNARRVLAYAAVSLLAAYGLAIAADRAIRARAPREVCGWGDRPALRPSARYGFTLIPDKQTRVRWLSYDYTISANSLGFPGPVYAPERAPGVARIIVTGDADESADGVDTDKSWPRLLESALGKQATPTELMTFSIAGWGPEQYARVVEDYAPTFRPDLIIVGLFVNDYDDVLLPEDVHRELPGFSRAAQNSLRCLAQLPHLKSLLTDEYTGRLVDWLGLKPYPNGYLFGHFSALERSRAGTLREAALEVGARLRRIVSTARSLGATVLVAEMPAPAQVCSRDQVDYYPNVDLHDQRRFDLDQPQRVTTALCNELGITCVDLRAALAGRAPRRPCMPRNRNLTEYGHELVAERMVGAVRQAMAGRFVPAASAPGP